MRPAEESHRAVGGGISRRVAKVLGLFSGLQMFTILCSIVKMKLVALWLHATGVGLFGIFNFSIETISTVTDLGLRQSAVRDLARHRNFPELLARTAKIVRAWSGIAGMLGAVVMVSLSPLLSRWFFDTWSNWWMFALLAASMLVNALANGENAILQGVGRLRAIAKIGFGGATLGLLVSIPMFRWLGEDSVVYSILAYSVATLIFVFFFRHKSTHHAPALDKTLVKEGKGFVRLGAYMAVAAFATNLAHMVFMAWLNRNASTDEVGYYQAGTAVVVRYVGMIFTAISMELYPRLAANSFSHKRLSMFVSHEVTLILLLLIPIILIFLLLRQWVVIILYTPEFLVIVPLISWAIMGMLFRAVSTCMAYTILARGDGKVFLLTECADSLIGLGLNIVCYNWWGLSGLGIAYLAWYFVYFLMVGGVYRFRYRLRFGREAVRITALAILLAAGGFLMVGYAPYWLCCVVLPGVALCFGRPLLKLLRLRRRHKAIPSAPADK